ncbi:MAG: hypothetical protein WKF40_00755 [Thermoleophilaceae bacterium]
MLDEDALAAGMDGCDLAYHVAGINSHCPNDPEAHDAASTSRAPKTAVRAAARGRRTAAGLHVLRRLGR